MSIHKNSRQTSVLYHLQQHSDLVIETISYRVLFRIQSNTHLQKEQDKYNLIANKSSSKENWDKFQV